MAKKSPTPVDAHVGRQIRHARMTRNMSQGDLGEMIGVTFQQVQKYEKGANRVGASRMQQIAKVLDRPVEYFFPGTGAAAPFPPDDPVQILGQTRAGCSLAKAFNEIGDEAIRAAIVHLTHLIAGREAA